MHRSHPVGHPTNRTRWTSATAFTLLEMLVVVGIIGVLAGLVVPALGRAKATARQSVCISNLRQINQAFRMYLEEENGLPILPVSSNPIARFGYRQAVQEHLGTTGDASAANKVLACPADRFCYDNNMSKESPEMVLYADQGWHERPSQGGWSYHANGLWTTTNREAGTSHPGIAGRTIPSIREPARTVLIAESAAFFPWSWHKPKRKLKEMPYYFNDSRNVVSFVDGHVGFMKMYHDPSRVLCLDSWSCDPPSGYDYRWSADE